MGRMRKSLVLLMIVAILLPSNWLGTGDLRAMDGGAIPSVNGSSVTESVYGSGGFMTTGQIIYVKENATGDGSSWDDAFGTLQQALESAVEGDEIWIAAGTYTPTKSVNDSVLSPAQSRSATFKMRPGVAIYGGFPTNSTNVTDWNDRNWEMYKTILSGDLNGDDTTDLSENKSDNAYNVFHHPVTLGLDEIAILDGVTITGGYSQSQGHGAGIRNDGNATQSNSPTIRNVMITRNVSGGNGGGLYNAYGSPTLTNVTVDNNQGVSGGGIYTHRGELIFVDGLIVNNIASSSGGGLTVDNGTDAAYKNYGAHLTRVHINGNNAKIANSHNGPGGGGVYVSYGSLKLTDLDITSNQTGSSGGGISGRSGTYVSENAFHLELNGVKISDNTSGLDGGGIATRYRGRLSVTGGEIRGNRAANNRAGGGINNVRTDMTLEHVVIRENEAHNGGGIATMIAESVLTNVAILDNRGVDGGGLHIGSSSPILTNVIIQGNVAKDNGYGAQGRGGGIFTNTDNNGIGQPMLRNVLITGNAAQGPLSTNGLGGGIYDSAGAFSTLINVTLAHNYAEEDGGGYYRGGGANSDPKILNSIIWGNKAERKSANNIKNALNAAQKLNLNIANSIVEDAFNLDGEWNTEYGTDNGGNYNVDPEFIAPAVASLTPSTAGDYSLAESSPAIDRGDNSYVAAEVATDLDGGLRVSGGIVDLGAYELNLDNEAPTWPAGADELIVAAVPDTPASVTVSWQEANDNVGVVAYFLTMDDGMPIEFPGTIFTNIERFEYTIEHLPESKIYTFKLIAVDAANNESHALVGVYDLKEADIEPPAPGTFAVNWSIARSAYPHMLALPEAPLEITASADAGQTLEAIIHYESWFDEQDETVLTEPHSLMDTVQFSADQANPERYKAEAQLPHQVGRIVSIDVIAEDGGEQTIVNREVDLLVAASYAIKDAQTGFGNHLIGSTMMLWSDHAEQGRTIKVSGEDTYTFSGLVPNTPYVFRFMEAGTNRPLRDDELIAFLPGQVLSEKKTIPAPATLRLRMTFAGGESAVPDGLVITVKDRREDQLISTKVTDADQAWTRLASGNLLFGEDELRLQVSGMEWPYVAAHSDNITLTAGINEVNIDIGYADRAFIEGTVELNVPDGQPLQGIQVTAIQTHPGASHRSFISKALTDEDGKYRIEVIANRDVVLQAANPATETVLSQVKTLSKSSLPTDAVVIEDFLLVPYPGPAELRVKITTMYIEGQSSQVWEPEQIDWRTAVHFRLSAKDARGRSYSSGYPFYVNANVGEKIDVCINGYEGDLPKQCVETTVELMPDGGTLALAEFELTQTGGIVRANVVDGLTGEPIHNWAGSLYFKQDGKLQSVNRNQHGIGNRARSSEMKLWLPEAGTYELHVNSGNKNDVRELTVTEGQVMDLGQLPLTAKGIFAGQANNELLIVEDELVQDGKLNLRAVYTNNGSSPVDGAEIRIALPHGASYVTSSAVWNNREPGAAEMEITSDSLLFKIGTIEVGGTGVVHFQIKADAAVTLADEIGTTAVIRYNHDGEQHDEVLGTASVPIIQVSMKAPSHTVKRDIMLYGSAPAGSEVTTYADQLVLGRSIASPSGSWSMEVELPNHHRSAVYVLHAIAESDSQLMSSGNAYVLYDETYPYLTVMSMEQRDGRKITVDPKAGVAHFPFVMAGHNIFMYEMIFNNPNLISNVWVRIGSDNNYREAKAVRDATGTYRATLGGFSQGPIYVDFDIDVDKLPTKLAENISYDGVNDHEIIRETVLSQDEEDLLEEAEAELFVVQGETFSLNYIEQVDVVLSDENLKNLVPIVVEGKQYYAEKLTFINNGDGFILGLYGEDLDDLKLIDEEKLVAALSDLNTELSFKSVKVAASLLKLTKIKKGIWKITKDTSGPIKSVTVDNPAFDDAVNALNAMISEAAQICDPILRADAQRTLKGMRDRDVIDYELKVNIVAAPLNLLGGIIIDNVKTAVYGEQVRLARKLLDAWLSRNNCVGKPPGTITMQPKFIYDPSGFVYEAVESNRIEGVQATLLYQDPEANNEWIVWDAEWYLQKNPHWTDVNGRYGWDVPEGNWQVIYEKEGYETAYSKDHYAPHPIVVLPPHFEVNIPMTSYQAPEVLTVESKSDGKYVDMTFSRYMQLNMFSRATILVETVCTVGQTACTNEQIMGAWTGVDAEQDEDGRELARTIRFTPDTVMSVGDTIAITVDSIIQSYAGVPMDEAYIKDVFIEKMPEKPIDPDPVDPDPVDPDPVDPDPVDPDPVDPDPEDPDPVDPDPEDPDPVDPDPTNPDSVDPDLKNPVYPSYPVFPLDESPMVTDDVYPIDPTIDQMIVVNDGELVIDIPAGAISGELHNVRMLLEAVDGTKYLQPHGYQWLNRSFQIHFTGEDKDGTKINIENLLKPIQVTIPLDRMQVESANPKKIAAFAFEQEKWRYLDGTFDQETNTYVLHLDQPGVIAVMLTNKYFPDIAGHWAQEIIEVMSGRGIVEGRSMNRFDPEAPITRAEYVALLTRVLHMKALPEETSAFTDVAEGDWYHGVIAAALSQQLVAGISETKFAPNLNITREQIAVLLQRAYAKVLASKGKSVSGIFDSTLASYADGDQVSNWAQDGMSFAVRYGIIQGRSKDTIAPKTMASRAEAVVMLQRFMDIIWNEMNK